MTFVLNEKEYAKLGKACREAKEGNVVVGSFAAEMIGESYPFSREMFVTLFKNYTDLELGYRFVAWMNNPTKKEV